MPGWWESGYVIVMRDVNERNIVYGNEYTGWNDEQSGVLGHVQGAWLIKP